MREVLIVAGIGLGTFLFAMFVAGPILAVFDRWAAKRRQNR